MLHRIPSEDEIEDVEALVWLERSDGKERTVGQDNENCLRMQDALRLVRELYAAGAPKVLVQNVVSEYEFEEASHLKIILPKDQNFRAALFVLEARALREMGSSMAPRGEQSQDFFTLGW